MKCVYIFLMCLRLFPSTGCIDFIIFSNAFETIIKNCSLSISSSAYPAYFVSFLSMNVELIPWVSLRP